MECRWGVDGVMEMMDMSQGFLLLNVAALPLQNIHTSAKTDGVGSKDRAEHGTCKEISHVH